MKEEGNKGNQGIAAVAQFTPSQRHVIRFPILRLRFRLQGEPPTHTLPLFERGEGNKRRTSGLDWAERDVRDLSPRMLTRRKFCNVGEVKDLLD